MSRGKATILSVYLVLAGLAGAWLSSCSNSSPGRMLILTRVPEASYHPGKETFLPVYPGAVLLSVSPEGSSGENPILTKDFFSACSPHLSYDGSHILFLAQKTEKSPWQVWEMDLRKKRSRQVTHCKESCYSPFYLPGNRLAFSREMPDTGNGSFLTLFTMNLDGSNLQQITFHPNNDFITTVLKDGRLLIHSGQVYPDKRPAKYLAMRPNGTKAEIFYQGAPGSRPGFRAWETGDGRVWFTEQAAGAPGKKDVISIRYNRPLHSRINHTEDIPGDFYSVLPAGPGKLFVSSMREGDRKIGLYSLSLKDNKLKKILADQRYHFIDPVLIQPYERPRNLPNELMYSYPTGLLMSQNINLTALSPRTKATRIEILGMDKSLGTVPVEQDGSFFLKIPADMPFRIQTLDEQGKVVLGPSDWLWVRPFERKGCVGCHEDPELSPQNIVPLAINSYPIVIPVDTTQPAKKAETFNVSKMK